MDNMKYIGSSHCNDRLKRRDTSLHHAYLDLLEYGTRKFDAIAVRGVSGLIIAPELARKLNKGLLISRKAPKDTHGQQVEGYFPEYRGSVRLRNLRYVILDDMVASGRTTRKIHEDIQHFFKSTNMLAGIEPQFVTSYYYKDRYFGDEDGTYTNPAPARPKT